MTTYTEKGAAKMAVTDPLGQRTADESVSVALAADQGRTAPTSEQTELLKSIDASLQFLVTIFSKARL